MLLFTCILKGNKSILTFFMTGIWYLHAKVKNNLMLNVVKLEDQGQFYFGDFSISGVFPTFTILCDLLAYQCIWREVCPVRQLTLLARLTLTKHTYRYKES